MEEPACRHQMVVEGEGHHRHPLVVVEDRLPLVEEEDHLHREEEQEHALVRERVEEKHAS